MHSKKQPLLFKLLLLLVILIVPSIHAATQPNQSLQLENQKILYVSVIPQSNHYTSIQAAIDDAEPYTTIVINPGEYTEQLRIKKPLQLIGSDTTKTFLNPTSESNGCAIVIQAEHVVVQQLSISNQGSGLYATGVKLCKDNIDILSCDIYDSPIGIAVWTSHNTISNCRFWGCDDEGIAFLGSNFNDCQYNTVTNCEFFNNCDGIELQYAAENTISGCTFHHNTHAGIDAIAAENNNNIIQNCQLYDNSQFSVYIVGSSGNQIINCTLKDDQVMLRDVVDTDVIGSKVDDMYLVDSYIQIQDCDLLSADQIKNVNSNIDFVSAITNQYESNSFSLRHYVQEIRTNMFNRISLLRERIQNLIQKIREQHYVL